MPRTLEQYEVHCGTCGEYLWMYKSTVYDLELRKEIDLERDDFCSRCDPRKFLGTIKSAEKIIPLTKNQRDDPST